MRISNYSYYHSFQFLQSDTPDMHGLFFYKDHVLKHDWVGFAWYLWIYVFPLINIPSRLVFLLTLLTIEFLYEVPPFTSLLAFIPPHTIDDIHLSDMEYISSFLTESNKQFWDDFISFQILVATQNPEPLTPEQFWSPHDPEINSFSNENILPFWISKTSLISIWSNQNPLESFIPGDNILVDIVIENNINEIWLAQVVGIDLELKKIMVHWYHHHYYSCIIKYTLDTSETKVCKYKLFFLILFLAYISIYYFAQ